MKFPSKWEDVKNVPLLVALKGIIYQKVKDILHSLVSFLVRHRDFVFEEEEGKRVINESELLILYFPRSGEIKRGNLRPDPHDLNIFLFMWTKWSTVVTDLLLSPEFQILLPKKLFKTSLLIFPFSQVLSWGIVYFFFISTLFTCFFPPRFLIFTFLRQIKNTPADIVCT